MLIAGQLSPADTLALAQVHATLALAAFQSAANDQAGKSSGVRRTPQPTTLNVGGGQAPRGPQPDGY